MTSRMYWAMLAVVSMILVGCGKSDEASLVQPATAGAAEAGSQAPSSNPAAKVDSSTPKAAATAFFAALRDSDEQTVAYLLTQKAREESKKHDVAIDPPQDPSATFSVGDVEYVETNGAYVSGTWTENTQHGSETIGIVWALRKEAGGWRIAGLHAKSSEETVVLNFEDPEEMHQRRIEAEQGMPPGYPAVEPIRHAQQPTPTGDYGTPR
jgi:hypothetical protein